MDLQDTLQWSFFIVQEAVTDHGELAYCLKTQGYFMADLGLEITSPGF